MQRSDQRSERQLTDAVQRAGEAPPIPILKNNISKKRNTHLTSTLFASSAHAARPVEDDFGEARPFRRRLRISGSLALRLERVQQEIGTTRDNNSCVDRILKAPPLVPKTASYGDIPASGACTQLPSYHFHTHCQPQSHTTTQVLARTHAQALAHEPARTHTDTRAQTNPLTHTHGARVHTKPAVAHETPSRIRQANHPSRF